MQVFLSHSSKDKGSHVEHIAKKLGVKAIYDNYTFEYGLKSFDEIIKHMGNSDLFVILISNSALESQWVKAELNIAKENIHFNLKQVYPVIIDKTINHNDERIPDWLKQYNLRVITQSQKITDLIKQQMRELVWSKNPHFRKKDLVYKGRHEQAKIFGIM
jgi:hypothetical protein